MLLSFRVRNYASLRDEQELSLTTSDPSAGAVEVDGSDLMTLPVAAIYGPNASGKSNVIKAFVFAIEAIRDSHQRWLPDAPIARWPFRLDAHSAKDPSEFVFEFVVDGVRFEYGFALDDSIIVDERLYSWPRGKRVKLFTRTAEGLDFGRALGGNKAAIKDLVRPNSLFLSAGAANNNKILARVSHMLGPHRQRVHRRPDLISDRDVRFKQVVSTAEKDQQLMDLIRYADLGIVGMAVRASPTNLERLLVEDFVRAESGEELRVKALGAAWAAGGDSVTWLHEAGSEAGAVSLPAHWESRGTVEWMFLISDALAVLRSGGTLLVDDLGGDLHPILVAQLVRLFLERSTNPRGAQLIFNTHEVSLLWRGSESRLRRDQIWFTQKAADGATSLYPLTDFRSRDNVDDFMGRYLHGRYEAVPYFEDGLLDSLRAGVVPE